VNDTTSTGARATTLLFGGAALSATGLRGRAQTNATIRIAVVPIEPAAVAYYASDMGFFAEADLDVHIQPMPGSSAIVPAVASNAVEYVSRDTRGTEAVVLPANSSIQ
jgi:ABC-type nitrate/sulfonate/bicarbonate transport system substrate-binding protein